jgi:TonB family protein
MHAVPFLASAAAKATLVFAVAYIATLILRRSSASSRYFVWMCTFGVVLLLPALSAFSPRWTLPVRTPAVAAARVAYDSVTVAGSSRAAGQVPTPVSKPAPVLEWAFAAWLCGAGLMFARLAIGHARMRRTLAGAAPIRDPEWSQLIEDLGGNLNVVKSPQTDVPLTYGPFRPAVVLPCDSDSWTADRRRVVLLHELVHVRRVDPLWHLLANIVLALHWFNPLAWIAAAQFRREQERSCDDSVLLFGTRPAAYAEHLVDLARSIADAGARWPTAALGMAENIDLERRVHALLEPGRKRHGVSRRFSIATVGAAIATIVPLAALHAQSSGVASLSGSVYDPSGAALPNATIQLRNLKGSNEEITQANAAGQYEFRGIPAGSYAVEARVPGFAKLQQPDVTLANGATVRLNLTLRLGEVSENVQVLGRGSRPVTSGPPQRIRVGGNVQATRLVSKVQPVYPSDAEAEGVEGTVLLRAIISNEGNLLSTTVLNTGIDARLSKAATDAISQWKYQPTLLNGQPVEVVTTISVNFRLEP